MPIDNYPQFLHSRIDSYVVQKKSRIVHMEGHAISGDYKHQIREHLISFQVKYQICFISDKIPDMFHSRYNTRCVSFQIKYQICFIPDKIPDMLHSRLNSLYGSFQVKYQICFIPDKIPVTFHSR